MNIEEQLLKAKQSCSHLLELSDSDIKSILLKISDSLLSSIDFILNQNQKDLDAFLQTGSQSNPNYDRLMLTSDRIRSIANDIKAVVDFDFSVDSNLLESRVVGDINISKVSVPLGVVAVIYESRPNVTVDVFTLCFRSQNACALKGGKEALNSNLAFVKIIKDVLVMHNLEDCVQFLNVDRSGTEFLINAREYVDVCIPRGGVSLIKYVRENATVPVIETGAGVVHLYFDEFGDIEIGKKVIFNSKTRRVSVCNALDCLIIHSSRLNDLPKLVDSMAQKNVTIYADERAFDILNDSQYPFLFKASKDDHGREYLDYKLFICVVDSVYEAIQYINKYTSHHSESIITDNKNNAALFSNKIDASVVYVNTSTSFTDGGQFGLGAEIGISTQKLHARGPMGVAALRTIKYIVSSNGAIRS